MICSTMTSASSLAGLTVAHHEKLLLVRLVPALSHMATSPQIWLQGVRLGQEVSGPGLGSCPWDFTTTASLWLAHLR